MIRALADYLLGIKDFRLSWTTREGEGLSHVLTFRVHEEE